MYAQIMRGLTFPLMYLRFYSFDSTSLTYHQGVCQQTGTEAVEAAIALLCLGLVLRSHPLFSMGTLTPGPLSETQILK